MMTSALTPLCCLSSKGKYRSIFQTSLRGDDEILNIQQQVCYRIEPVKPQKTIL